jgi:hypothetical protein
MPQNAKVKNFNIQTTPDYPARLLHSKRQIANFVPAIRPITIRHKTYWQAFLHCSRKAVPSYAVPNKTYAASDAAFSPYMSGRCSYSA